MGVGYVLVNHTKREQILFAHLPVNKKREICGNPASAAIVAWYLLENSGDNIAFVPGSFHGRPDVTNYTDVTDALVTRLVEEGILGDFGVAWRDDDEPETVFIRDIRNIWLST